MIEKVVGKKKLHDAASGEERAYWLSRTPVERVNAVEFLRKQYYGEYPEGLQRVYSIIKRKKG